MLLIADTNIVALTVQRLRADGHNEETNLLFEMLTKWGPQLTVGFFVRAGKWGSKIADNPLA